MRGAGRAISAARGSLGLGTRGRGSEMTAAPVWGFRPRNTLPGADPWPLNPMGELLLGVKLKSRRETRAESVKRGTPENRVRTRWTDSCGYLAELVDSRDSDG
jgi:hypothetical protein